MTDPTAEDNSGLESESIDLTQTIRKLSVPVDTINGQLDELAGIALLLCRDNDSRKWGPRWLGQSGLQTTVPSDPANALELARSTLPDVIVVEAALTGNGGDPLYKILLDAADVTAALVVLCVNSREFKAALEAGAHEVARKPYEWQIIANRARLALQQMSGHRLVEAANNSLQEALTLANVARERLRSQESVEPITGLPNKAKFMDLLRRGMQASARDGTALAVFVIGFTRFRLVIEAMGQDQADRILTHFGRNLGECLASAGDQFEPSSSGLRTAAIASLDEFRFAMMMTHSGGDDSLAAFQQQLFDTLSRPVQISGQVVHLSTCLGIALYPQDADDVDSLLQRADNAMRDAQSVGGGCKYYCAATDRAAARKLKIEHMLHESLDNNELSLVYQPILDVATGNLVAAEALLRWRQPDGSYIPTEEFVAVAEESGLVLRMGEYVLVGACAQFAQWRISGVALPHVCVNVAKAQLMSSGFSSTVRQILELHKMAPGELELEISERGVLSGDYDVIKQLHELKSLGVKLSIDDFGTGDSAIAYLKDLPVDTLKIDRSYIAAIADGGKDAALAAAMVALGQHLDLMVVAEGVETEEQMRVLQNVGCNSYQGFLTAKPLTNDVFAAFALKLAGT